VPVSAQYKIPSGDGLTKVAKTTTFDTWTTASPLEAGIFMICEGPARSDTK
jgi:hypothetical protein